MSDSLREKIIARIAVVTLKDGSVVSDTMLARLLREWTEDEVVNYLMNRMDSCSHGDDEDEEEA